MLNVSGSGIPNQRAEHDGNNAEAAQPAGAEQRRPAVAATSRSYRVVRRAARLFNPLVLTLAGTRLMPLYGVIEHHGRRSGKTYHTPVVVRPTSDGFIVPMPWGERTDWYRNVRTAGECVIRWKGRDYPLGQPELIDDPAAVRASFGAFERAVMARVGIDQCLRLRRRTPKSRDAPPSTDPRAAKSRLT